MKQKLSQHNSDQQLNGMTDDARFENLLSQLPDPGPAYVSAKVMSRIRRQPGHITIAPRHILVTLASSAVGILMGIWLANYTVPNVGAAINPVLGFSDPMGTMDDGLDYVMYDIILEGQGS